MNNIIITSNAFHQGGSIPVKYTCDGENISPPLTWSGIPSNTQSIALIMEDPDAPGGIFVHWIIFNIPSFLTELPEDIPKFPVIVDGIQQRTTSFGTIGYGGPCPPRGETHRYFFKIFALDIRLTLPPGASKSDILREMNGHILSTEEFIGFYKRI